MWRSLWNNQKIQMKKARFVVVPILREQEAETTLQLDGTFVQLPRNSHGPTGGWIHLGTQGTLHKFDETEHKVWYQVETAYRV